METFESTVAKSLPLSNSFGRSHIFNDVTLHPPKNKVDPQFAAQILLASESRTRSLTLKDL